MPSSAIVVQFLWAHNTNLSSAETGLPMNCAANGWFSYLLVLRALGIMIKCFFNILCNVDNEFSKEKKLLVIFVGRNGELTLHVLQKTVTKHGFLAALGINVVVK